jgi:hypothetical protein
MHHYTVAEANALLPELSRVLTELRDHAQQLASLKTRESEVKKKVRSNGYHNPGEDTMVASITTNVEEGVNEGINQLNEWNIELKDVSEGLVDFPAMHEGRTVFLCWKLGEPEVAFWHEISSGFAGRQAIDSTFE